MRRGADVLAILGVSLLLFGSLGGQVTAQERRASQDEIRDLGSLGAGSGNWKILVLIYGRTDQFWIDASGVPHHVVAQMTNAEKRTAAATARRFVRGDIPRLTSGAMVPTATVRFPDRTLRDLDPNGGGFWPSPSNTAPDRDPAFDAVIVIWDPRGTNLLTGQPEWIGSAAGLTPGMGTGQAYETQIIESALEAAPYAHRNVFKHEFGHSILFYYDASGKAPKPAVSNHIDANTYVHCPTGESYVWLDETLADPIPNSIYNDDSGFTHDYYSGTTALAGNPTECLGVTRQAWELGGPITPGPLSGSSYATAIDDRGQIAGVTATASDDRYGPDHAFLSQHRVMSDIGGLSDGSSVANAIVPKGNQTLIAGDSTTADGVVHATLWMGGRPVDLGTMAETGVQSHGSGVNRHEQVVGTLVGPHPGIFRAFLWENGRMNQLGGVPDGDSSGANAINDHGEVAGWIGIPQGHGLRSQAVLWTESQVRLLGSLGGNSSRALAINRQGDIVGQSQIESGYTHAFLWRKDSGSMIDLGTLGGSTSIAYGINAHDQIVGESVTASGELRAFVWDHGVMTDLGTLGGSASSAHAINDKGQIVGSSTDTLGRTRAVLWTAP